MVGPLIADDSTGLMRGGEYAPPRIVAPNRAQTEDSLAGNSTP
jgi:hypothetical protein